MAVLNKVGAPAPVEIITLVAHQATRQLHPLAEEDLGKRLATGIAARFVSKFIEIILAKLIDGQNF